MNSKDLRDVRETKELNSFSGIDGKINEWLPLGWQILRIWTVNLGGAAASERIHVLLGWLNDRGEPRYPEEKPEPDYGF